MMMTVSSPSFVIHDATLLEGCSHVGLGLVPCVGGLEGAGDGRARRDPQCPVD